MAGQYAETIEVKASALRRFNEGIERRLGRVVWCEGGCKSGYLDADGVNRALWPGFSAEDWARTRRAPRRLCGPLTGRGHRRRRGLSTARLTSRGFIARLLRLGVRPDAVEELADLGGQAGRAYPQLGEGAGPDQPGVSKLPGEPLCVAE